MQTISRLRTTFKHMSSAVKSGNVERYVEEALAFRRNSGFMLSLQAGA